VGVKNFPREIVFFRTGYACLQLEKRKGHSHALEVSVAPTLCDEGTPCLSELPQRLNDAITFTANPTDWAGLVVAIELG